MLIRSLAWLGTVVFVLALAACSGSQTTSSTEPLAPVSNDPQTRAMQVAWTAERAQRCGFHVDQAKLKANYLGYETAQGLTPQQIGQLDGAYDKIRALIAPRIKDPAYCTETVVSEIRSDLGRYLAGDFTPRSVRRPVDPDGELLPDKINPAAPAPIQQGQY